MAAAAAGIEPPGRLCAELPETTHLDILSEGDRPRFAVIISRANRDQVMQINCLGRWQGIFSGITLEMNGATSFNIPANYTEIFRIITSDSDK